MPAVSLPLAPKRSWGKTSRPGPLVDSTRAGLHGPFDLRGLLHVGRVSERPLFFRALSVADVFAGSLGEHEAGSSRASQRLFESHHFRKTDLVSQLAAVFAGLAHPLAPAGFRLTCYYYRGAYYKAFEPDPPNCAVGEPMQRLHRRKQLAVEDHEHPPVLPLSRDRLYFVLTYDALLAMWFTNPDTNGAEFGIGVGTILCVANVILLGGYTFGCHSLRHLVGGDKDCISQSPFEQVMLQRLLVARTNATCSGPG